MLIEYTHLVLATGLCAKKYTQASGEVRDLKRITIHEWRNWLLEYIGDDNYALSQKDSEVVHTIVAKNAMDAENQCQQIIKNAKEEGV